MVALCVKYLHRHPYELEHLPADALLDLIALAESELEVKNELDSILR